MSKTEIVNDLDEVKENIEKYLQDDSDVLKTNIDFIAFIEVDNANPNGNPTNGMPRQCNDDRGLITDVCIKSKIRKYLHAKNYEIYLHNAQTLMMTDKVSRGVSSLQDILLDNKDFALLKNKGNTKNMYDKKLMCGVALRDYIDIRLFGFTPTFKGIEDVNIRGSLSIGDAISVCPVELNHAGQGIVKGLPFSTASDTMGQRYRIQHGLYKVTGGIGKREAYNNHVTNKDMEVVKEAIGNMFLYDASVARPRGSMSVMCLYWVEHNKDYDARRIYDSVVVKMKDDVDYPTCYADYVIDDSALHELERYDNEMNITIPIN